MTQILPRSRHLHPLLKPQLLSTPTNRDRKVPIPRRLRLVLIPWLTQPFLQMLNSFIPLKMRPPVDGRLPLRMGRSHTVGCRLSVLEFPRRTLTSQSPQSQSGASLSHLPRLLPSMNTSLYRQRSSPNARSTGYPENRPTSLGR